MKEWISIILDVIVLLATYILILAVPLTLLAMFVWAIFHFD